MEAPRNAPPAFFSLSFHSAVHPFSPGAPGTASLSLLCASSSLTPPIQESPPQIWSGIRVLPVKRKLFLATVRRNRCSAERILVVKTTAWAWAPQRAGKPGLGDAGVRRGRDQPQLLARDTSSAAQKSHFHMCAMTWLTYFRRILEQPIRFMSLVRAELLQQEHVIIPYLAFIRSKTTAWLALFTEKSISSYSEIFTLRVH